MKFGGQCPKARIRKNDGPLSPTWKSKVFQTDAFRVQVGELARQIDAHYEYLISSGVMGQRIRRQVMVEINEALRSGILDPILENLEASGELERMISMLMKKESDPHSLVEQMTKRYMKEGALAQ